MRTKGSISYEVLKSELLRLEKRKKKAIVAQERASLDGSIITIKKLLGIMEAK